MDVAGNKLKGIGTKIAMIPEHNAVVTANGFAFVEFMLQATLALSWFENFDALASGFPNLINKAVLNGVSYGCPSTWRDTEIVLAGWSSINDAPTALMFGSNEKFAGKEITRLIRPAVPNLVFNTQDIEQSGLELMRAQRASAFSVTDSQSASFIKPSYSRRVVHGFCQHTTVSRSSIETRVIERWPDVVSAESQT
jgi:hypothetical protein